MPSGAEPNQAQTTVTPRIEGSSNQSIGIPALHQASSRCTTPRQTRNPRARINIDPDPDPDPDPEPEPLPDPPRAVNPGPAPPRRELVPGREISVSGPAGPAARGLGVCRVWNWAGLHLDPPPDSSWAGGGGGGGIGIADATSAHQSTAMADNLSTPEHSYG
ncbi:unnamed protein product [Diplocarpon coronariae]